MRIGHCKEFIKLSCWELAFLSDEFLTLKTPASETFYGSQFSLPT